jgi:hypothetical protein
MFTNTHHTPSLERFVDPAYVAAAAASAGAVAVVALAVAAGPASAQRMPEPGSAVVSTSSASEKSTSRACFMGRHRWSDALAGPPPVCR